MLIMNTELVSMPAVVDQNNRRYDFADAEVVEPVCETVVPNHFIDANTVEVTLNTFPMIA